jgi:hypothetical protein
MAIQCARPKNDQPCAGGKFVVSSALEAYDSQVIEANREFRIELQDGTKRRP